MQSQKDTNPAYKNFYHENDEALTEIEKKYPQYTNSTGIKMTIIIAYAIECAYLHEKWADVTITQSIPVYIPKTMNPIAFWMIFSDKN